MSEENYEDEVQICVERLVHEIYGALEKAERVRDRKKACILSVPKALLGDNGKLYYPQMVSIGPYHNYSPKYVPDAEIQNVEYLTHADKERRKQLRGMEWDKLLAVHKFWGRNSLDAKAYDIAKNSKLITDQYDRDLSRLQNEKLVEMLFVDVAFVVEFLKYFVREQSGGIEGAAERSSCRGSQEENDAVFLQKTNSPVLFGILMDLMKLENQLPMFILKQAMRYMNNGDDVLEDLLSELCAYVSCIKSQNPWPRDAGESAKLRLSDCKHILDCFRKTIVSKSRWDEYKKQKEFDKSMYSKPSYGRRVQSYVFSHVRLLTRKVFQVEDKADEEKKYLPFGASKLKNTGVMFEVLTHGGIWDIDFDPETAILRLPKVDIGLWTETLLRNLLAFEACYSGEDIDTNLEGKEGKEKLITRFVLFMSQLVESDADAGVLREEGIIEDNLGDNERVKQLWNGLCSSGWVPKCEKFDTVTKKLNTHVGQCWVGLFTEGWNTYCSKPWFVLAVVGSIIVIAEAIASLVTGIKG